MSVQQILLALHARYKIALLLLLATIAIALPLIQRLPKQYTATASLVVDVRSPDPVTAILRPSNMATQEDIIKSDRVAQRVVDLLRLQDDAAAREQWRLAAGGKGTFEAWLVARLQKKLTVTPPRRDSNVLSIDFSAADAATAAAVANAFAQAYMDVSVELKVEPAKQYAHWFAEQGKSQREKLEKAQARLSEFQQKKGLIAGKEDAVDAETARLSELTSQLTVLQAQTSDTRSKERSRGQALPELMQNPVISGLRIDINRQEAKLKDAAANLGVNHPRYRAMEAELQELKSRLQAEIAYATKGYAASTQVGVDKENELMAAIEAQKKKILQMRSLRDQLAVLQRDVDAAKNAYDAVAHRYMQANLESQATQTNVFLLNPAVEPLAPSNPNVVRLMLMAVVFGALAGLAAALGLEMLDRRVRSADDVTQMLQLPVLTVVPDFSRKARRYALPLYRRPGLPAP
jgi:succinoglycan biosynthesis transport protein ExoP